MEKITKQLRWLLASLMLVVGMSAWAQDPYYTLDTTTDAAKTTSNSYAGTGTVTIDGIEWAVNGNGQMYPWRLGGKSISNTDRTVNTNTAMGSAINKVVLTVGTASSITVNSLKLTVASNASFSDVLDEVTATFAASSDITFEPSTGTEWATGAYYKFTFNVTVSQSSNKFVQFSGVKFYAPEGTGSDPSVAADNVDIAYDATSGQIVYTVSNPVTGGSMSAATTSEWVTLSNNYTSPIAFTCTANTSASERSATVTLTYTYGTKTATKNVTITQAGNPNLTNNISDITAAGTYAVKGTIVAKSQRGFIVGDGTGYVYYYNSSYDQSAYNIGDKVKLSGTVVAYGGVFEFNNSTTVTSVTESNYVEDTPTVLSGSDMDSRVSSTTPAQLSSFVQFEGTLSVNGTYYNITDIDGATTAQGSISYPINTDFTSLNGKTVKVTGYFVGVSSSKYYNTLIGSIEEVVGAVASPSFSLAEGLYSGAQTVTITSATTGANIYYTTDGTNPTTASTPYTTPITINTSTTLKAIAVVGSDISTVTTASYVILAHAGTEADPYTVADAIAFINTLGTSTSENEVYVKGIISRVYSYNETYGSITYWISDDGTTNNQMEVYGGLNFADVNEGRFESKDDLQTGDEVTVCGHVKMYSSTPEFDTDSHLVAFFRPAQKADPELSFGETTTFTITVGDAFTAPTLSNPHNLTVTYSGNNDYLATVNAETGALTFVSGVTGNITVTATFEGDEDYKEGSASYTLIVNAAAGEGDYIKLTSTTELIDGGQYLIVYEEGSVAFNSSLETLDAVGNTINVVISDEKIASNATVDAAAFTIEAIEGGYSIKGSNGKYIGRTNSSNGLNTSDEALTNTISFDGGNAVITGIGDYTLRYNSASNQKRFRYYSNNSQKPIALYLKNGIKDTREETSITFSEYGPFNVNFGDEFNNEPTATLEPTEAGSASDITFSSSDESIATVDATTGKVTIVGPGTCGIIAAFGGNENYLPCSAMYVINVIKTIAPNPKNINTEYYVKVTGIDQIEDGDAVIIVYEYGNVAMNTTQNPNNRTAVAIEQNNGTIQLTDGTGGTLNNIPVTEKVILVKEGNFFYLYASRTSTGPGYLCAASNSSNILHTEAEPEGKNARAAISFDEEGNANIVFQCDRPDITGLRGTLRWNNVANVFSCYAAENNQQPIQLYVEVEKEATETVELVDAQDCYKTMAAPYNMDLTGSDLKAYIVTLNDEQNEAEFVQVTKIPAGTPIILHSETAGTYELNKAGSNFTADNVADNELKESDGTVTGDASTIYVLNKNPEIGFYLLNSGKTLAEGKCYLQIVKGNGAKFIGFHFEGEATGIAGLESANDKLQGTIYNLAGQRVTTPAHGLYIVNGKKVFIK